MDVPQILIPKDDPIARPDFSRLCAKDCAKCYPFAVIDEVQKLLCLMETVKANIPKSLPNHFLLVSILILCIMMKYLLVYIYQKQTIKKMTKRCLMISLILLVL